jgi:hypothetical protein
MPTRPRSPSSTRRSRGVLCALGAARASRGGHAGRLGGGQRRGAPTAALRRVASRARVAATGGSGATGCALSFEPLHCLLGRSTFPLGGASHADTCTSGGGPRRPRQPRPLPAHRPRCACFGWTSSLLAPWSRRNVRGATCGVHALGGRCNLDLGGRGRLSRLLRTLWLL